MFNIYTASEKDVPVIIDMAERTWWPTYRTIIPEDQIRYMLHTIYGPETLSRQIKDGTQVFLILKDERGPQGFASYSRRSDHPLVFKLHKLYVLPNNHGKGFGSALITEIKDRLLTDNFHILDVNVNRMNPAFHFYEKLGFHILREEDIPIGPYWMNDYVMRMQF